MKYTRTRNCAASWMAAFTTLMTDYREISMYFFPPFLTSLLFSFLFFNNKNKHIFSNKSIKSVLRFLLQNVLQMHLLDCLTGTQKLSLTIVL